MTEYTPGPWAAFDAVLKGVKVRQFLIQPKEGHEHPDDFSDIIAEIPWQHFSEEEREANARLIAQAPTLLEAAKAAVRGQVINNWVTAGEWVCRNCGEMPGEHAHDEGCWVALCNAAIAAAEGVE